MTPRAASAELIGTSTGTSNANGGQTVAHHRTSVFSNYFSDARARIDRLCAGLWQHLLDQPALQAACSVLHQARDKRQLSGAVNELLNTISPAVVAYARDNDTPPFGCEGTIVWFSARENDILGDFMDKSFVPEHRCVVLDHAATGDTSNLSRTPWQLTMGVGEVVSSQDDEMARHKSDIATHLRYRIDCPTVRGYVVDQVAGTGADSDEKKFQLRVTAMNRRGFWNSPTCPVDDLQAWIAYVCEVYEAYTGRIRSIEPVVNGTQVFHKFSLFEEKMIVTPVYAKAPPGCTTFIGFADAGNVSETAEKDGRRSTSDGGTAQSLGRVVKISWQDTTPACHETRMYDAAHGTNSGTWNSGLARHEHAERLLEFGVTNPTRPALPTLYPEITTLRSLGEPLSECRSMRELFKVIYDACLTLEDMYSSGVLHRDISGKNVLCRPVHKNTGNRIVAEQRRCIDYVLGTGNNPSEYKCLLVDLDLATLCPESNEPDCVTTAQLTAARHHRGTPMFMALDLLGVQYRTYDSKSFLRMGAGPKFFSPDESEPDAIPDATSAFARAFSPEAAQRHGYKDDGHILLYTEGELLAAFRKLHAHCNSNLFHQQRPGSNKLVSTQLNAVPSTIHGLRHDVESLVWAMTYTMARAAPKSPKEQLASVQYGQYVRCMCNEDGSGGQKYAASEMRLEAVLHSDFEELAEVVEAMRDYLLAIPWQRMEEDETFPKELRLHPAHAAVVMRRILLTALTNPDLKNVLDIELNTAFPRELDPPLSSNDQLSSTSNLGSVQCVSTGHTSGSANSSRKRGAEEVTADRSAKRSKIASSPAVGQRERLARKVWKDRRWYSTRRL